MGSACISIFKGKGMLEKKATVEMAEGKELLFNFYF